MGKSMNNFDWKHAYAFLVTAETGSFSAAARLLGLTQPTLGRQVSALEQALGITLFERVSGGIELTPNGYDLLDHVKMMKSAADALALSASGRMEAIEGEVCITATEIIAAYILPDIVRKIRLEAPNLKITVVASNETSDLIRREADIAIRAFEPTEPDLISRKIKNMNVRLYASRKYLSGVKNRNKPEDLSDCDFLGFGALDSVISELRQVGFDLRHENFPIVVKNHMAQWEYVRQGLGIGFMLENIGDSDPLVDRVLPNMEPFVGESWLVVHKELKTSRKLRLVFDALADELG